MSTIGKEPGDNLKARVSQKLDDILVARRQQEQIAAAPAASNLAAYGSSSKEETYDAIVIKSEEKVVEEVEEQKAEPELAIIIKDCEVYADQQLFELLEFGEESKHSIVPNS